MTNIEVNNAMFTYGKSKCAVILHDMVTAFDEIYPGSRASKTIGSAIAEVFELREMVGCHFVLRQNAGRPVPYKEHIIWRRVENLCFNIELDFPKDMSAMFRAVCKEQINANKAEALRYKLNVPEYTVQELTAWRLEDRVTRARNRFVSKLRKGVRYSGN